MATNNSEINKQYLNNKATADTRGLILASIAKHYGCEVSVIENELFNDGAEHLLDYISDTLLRDLTHAKMKSLKLA